MKVHSGFPVCSAVTATFLTDHKIISRRLGFRLTFQVGTTEAVQALVPSDLTSLGPSFLPYKMKIMIPAFKLLFVRKKSKNVSVSLFIHEISFEFHSSARCAPFTNEKWEFQEQYPPWPTA